MGFLHYQGAGSSGFTGEVCETVAERAVLLDGSAQFLGSRVFAMPGGQQRILLLLDGRDERLDAVVDETGRRSYSGPKRCWSRRRRNTGITPNTTAPITMTATTMPTMITIDMKLPASALATAV
ncbi:MAG: hypothetical protein ACLP8X_39275 [Streptosporangiaceae bacterium]